MATKKDWVKSLLTRSHSRPRNFENVKYNTMDSSKKIEEETLPYYKAEEFYPVHIGQVFEKKYQVLGKLGYGAFSTVWFCRDLSKHRYVAIKVCTQSEDSSQQANRELKVYERLVKLGSTHPGTSYIRELIDHFELDGPHGRHTCLVQPPMHLTIHELQSHGTLDEALLRDILIRLLQALDFLHHEAHVIHTDIKATNIMLAIDDESMLADFEKAEKREPKARKIIDDERTIYQSRRFRSPKKGAWGSFTICDFGEARIGESHRGRIQPQVYRAPEVLFRMGWNSTVDIWNVGVMIWDLFEGKHLFEAIDENKDYSASHHVAEMVAYLGNPSPEYVERSAETRNVFDDHGDWLGEGGVSVPKISLSNSEKKLHGRDQEMFLQFIKSMLTWAPEQRKTAKQLLDDPWLKGLTH